MEAASGALATVTCLAFAYSTSPEKRAYHKRSTAGVLEAVKGFRRLKGHKDMPRLVAALRARDQQLGLAPSVENVA